MADVLGRPLVVANAGVDLFADELERQGVRVDRVEWRPPRARRRGGARAPRARCRRDRARQRRGGRADRVRAPASRRRRPARDLLPASATGTLLHAGPPIDWADMSGPLRGAVIGAAVTRAWPATTRTPSALRRRGGEFEFGPVPRARRGRADGRRRQRVDAGVGDRERRARQPRVLHVQRRARQGAAVRRLRARGDRAARWLSDVLAPLLAGAPAASSRSTCGR